jgi:chaperonin cofactor prefoldin
MTWFWRTTREENRDLLRTEERLSIIAQLQADLNQHSQQIKHLTSIIVQALATDVNVMVLAKIAPMLAAILPLLQEMKPTTETIEADFATLHEGQRRIQAEISRVVSMITDLATQLRNTA